MKPIYFFVWAMLAAVAVSAQTNQLSGTIYDAQNHEPLNGATIKTGNSTGVVTGKDGSFALPCADSLDVTISYVGCEPYHVVLANCSQPLNVSLNRAGYNLNDVEITTTSNQNKALLYQPVTITKLGATEINRGQGVFMTDAINQNVPGVHMQSRGVSSGQQFNIRGYGNGIGIRGANSNFDTQGSKVYLNGIPVTDAEGITVMDDIDFGTIGNVEITKGPAGSLYGLAVAGVVNLKTVRPTKGQTSITQDLQFGSYGFQRYTTSLKLGMEKASVVANYGHQKSDGYMPHNASRKDYVSVAGEFTPNSKQTVTTYFGYSNSYDQRAGELTIAQYDTGDYSGNPQYIIRDAHSSVVSFRGGVGHTYAFNKHISNTTVLFATGLITNASSAGGWTDKNSLNYGLRSTIDVNYAFKGGWGISGLVGTELQQQRAQIVGYNMVVDSANPGGYYKLGAMRSNQFAVDGTWSFLSEVTATMPYDFSLTFGAGVSSLKIDLEDRFYVATNKNPTKYGTQYKNLFSPRVSLNKVFKKQFSVYFTYSRGYKAPTSSNIYISAIGAVNSSLRAEMGDQFEIGTKGSLANNRLYYEVALYDAVFSNKMMAVAVPLDSGNATAYTYTANGGKQDNKGVEVLIKAVAYESPKGYITIRPWANFNYSYFRYKDYQFQALNGTKTEAVISDYTGQPVAGVSPITANAGLDLSFKYGFYATLNYMYKSAMPITSDNKYKTDDYHLLNTKIGFQHTFFKHLGVNAYFGVNNLTGTKYYQMVFVNQLPDAYIPAPRKANFYGGISLTGIF